MKSQNLSPVKPLSSLIQWRFCLSLCLQIALILTVPVQAAYTLVFGKTAILQTIPVDPYDPLRGYSQTLRYDISRPETLRSLPGWETLTRENNRQTSKSFYVILAPPSSGQSRQPWKAIAISRDRPQNLPTNQLAIRGKMSGYTWIDYGLEAYYFPEEQQQQISQAVSRSGEKPSLTVEVKIDDKGDAVAVSFWVGDRRYQF